MSEWHLVMSDNDNNTRLSLSLAEANGSSLSPEHAAAAGRMIDQLAGRVKALEDLNALLVEQRDTALSSAESAEGRARRAEAARLRRQLIIQNCRMEPCVDARAALASPPATADHVPVRYTPRERDTRTFPAEIPVKERR